jgi:hypothetical protein
MTFGILQKENRDWTRMIKDFDGPRVAAFDIRSTSLLFLSVAGGIVSAITVLLVEIFVRKCRQTANDEENLHQFVK